MEFRTVTKKDMQNDVVLWQSYKNVIENRQNVPIIDFVVIDEHTVMRLDLIALHYYKSYDELDLLLKFNRITNPFEVPIGKIVMVPERNALIAATKFTHMVSVKEARMKKDGVTSTAPGKKTFDTRSIIANRGNGKTEKENGVLKF